MNIFLFQFDDIVSIQKNVLGSFLSFFIFLYFQFILLFSGCYLNLAQIRGQVLKSFLPKKQTLDNHKLKSRCQIIKFKLRNM